MSEISLHNPQLLINHSTLLNSLTRRMFGNELWCVTTIIIVIVSIIYIVVVGDWQGSTIRFGLQVNDTVCQLGQFITGSGSFNSEAT